MGPRDHRPARKRVARELRVVFVLKTFAAVLVILVILRDDVLFEDCRQGKKAATRTGA